MGHSWSGRVKAGPSGPAFPNAGGAIIASTYYVHTVPYCNIDVCPSLFTEFPGSWCVREQMRGRAVRNLFLDPAIADTPTYLCAEAGLVNCFLMFQCVVRTVSILWNYHFPLGKINVFIYGIITFP